MDVPRTNKLKKITKVVISLNELDNSDNLEDGRPSNTEKIRSPKQKILSDPNVKDTLRRLHDDFV